MMWDAKWIKPAADMGDVVPVFVTNFQLKKKVISAKLVMTAMGVYEATLNGERVGEFVLAPGWTSYINRLQYQEYDVTELLQKENHLMILVAKGWYHDRILAYQELKDLPLGLLAQLELFYEDGTKELVVTDEHWKVSESRVRFAEIYDGEIYDAGFQPSLDKDVEVFEGPSHTLIAQEGVAVYEQEKLAVAKVIITPKGETVLDFGQNLTGYIETTICANAGEVVSLSFGEVLDKQGNFYNENYRSAKCLYRYICRDGVQVYHPKLTFYGFRYVRIDEFPGGVECAKPENFKAIVIYSEMKRRGYFSCSNQMLNQLFENTIWGQKGNFVDVPTDCPQRDERRGWTGDAQIFIRTACLNFDVETFFTKWLADLASDQKEDGRVAPYIPNLSRSDYVSAGWGDAATICPWEIYLAYGNPAILKQQYESMQRWVDFITSHTQKEYLWTGSTHYGDWLALDVPVGEKKGASREELIASAYYAYSTLLLVKAGKVLQKDVSEYETLYQRIVKAFQEEYTEYKTQTECAIAVHFRLAKDCRKTSDQLAQMVKDCGMKMQTGFIGTPYILHALSDFGHADIAYDLLLREEYPSWIYPITKGATTNWEHWDGIMENGDFWDASMNSFNHYAYGAVVDWIYTVAAGIKTIENNPGYEKVIIAPCPDCRLDWMNVSLHTKYGEIRSEWRKQETFWRYEITTPVETSIIIDEKEYVVQAGTYLFFSER